MSSDDHVSIKEYVDRRFDDQDKAVQAALVSQEKAVQAALIAAKEAVDKANTASEKRFDSVNEFRQTLSDQTATFIPRGETEQRIGSLRSETEQRITSIAETVSGLTDRLNTAGGVKRGSDETWKVITTIIIVGIAILGFVGFK